MAGSCPVCGTAHAACGAGAAPVVPVDIPTSTRRPVVAELARYEVAVRGHSTTMKLSADDAERLGGKKVGSVKPAEPQPVVRPPYANDSSAVESEATPMQAEVEEAAAARPEKKAPPRRNKAAAADGEKS